MGANSKIEWCHHTFNPWRGCTKVSEGCANCYAETWSKRNPRALGVWGPRGKRIVAADAYWREPLKWNAEAREAGERRRVFCASLADVGEGPDTMPVDAWEPVQAARRRLSDLIRRCSYLDFLLLTKRPQNMLELFEPDVLARSWVGTSVEHQEAATERIRHLLKIFARVLFLSCEPLLGSIDFNALSDEQWNYNALTGLREDPFGDIVTREQGRSIDWVIVGGESGPLARECHTGIIESIVDQCRAAGVPVFVKQLGSKPRRDGGLKSFPMNLRDRKGGDPSEWPSHLRLRQMSVAPAAR